MSYIKLAGTGLRPSVLTIGSNRFGTLIDRGHAFELLDLFMERGGSMIDTAHVCTRG